MFTSSSSSVRDGGYDVAYNDVTVTLPVRVAANLGIQGDRTLSIVVDTAFHDFLEKI